MLQMKDNKESKSTGNQIYDRQLIFPRCIFVFYLLIFGIQLVYIEGYKASYIKAFAMIISPLLMIISRQRLSIAWPLSFFLFYHNVYKFNFKKYDV